jgi:hypothetical protein
MKTSPTQRSLKWLRQRGFAAAITERWCSFSKRRIDLFGFIDIVALCPIGIVGVQTTRGANVAARISKIRELDAARRWLDVGGHIIVHGWRKVGARGARKLWECREVRLGLVYGEIQEVES